MKIIVSLETKKSLELAERIKDYVDGFKINHLLWDEIVAWPDSWKKELFVDFKLWDTPNTVKQVVQKLTCSFVFLYSCWWMFVFFWGGVQRTKGNCPGNFRDMSGKCSVKCPGRAGKCP